MGRPSRGAAADRGAAALEFALVVPLLLILMFAMIDYGIYFSDALGARSGVQEAARAGAVNQCPDWACVADLVENNIDAIAGGVVYVNAFTEDVGSNGPGWKRGNNLVVCAVLEVKGLTGGVEALSQVDLFPDGGTTRARTTMRIEQDALPHPTGPGPVDVLPAGDGDWSFCT
jgi:Flp pilus assembly protein TadG